VAMPKFPSSFKLSEIPSNIYLSPSFLFEWWDAVIHLYGSKTALEDKSPDYSRARELWVSAIFACCKRISSSEEHWVKPVYDVAPDAIVAYMKRDELGFGELKYQIEVTTCGSDDKSLEDVLKAKLDKAYTQDTRIICYVTELPEGELIRIGNLKKFIEANNPRGYEVWLLSSIDIDDPDYEVPMRLICLTSDEGYDIDYAKEKLVKNVGDAFRIADGKQTNRKGTVPLIGKVTLEFPEIPRT
jgi:hypothetical protein